ncbi:MAG TPA: PKD domain-containing protein [Methanomicrobiales archaeon]|nr:PKD domain-containing protein [Methanomicrobiales archaeon]
MKRFGIHPTRFLRSRLLRFLASLPKAGFTAFPRAGEAPLAVSFLDLSCGHPTSRAWDFGDGAVSTDQNPVHIYHRPGIYQVILTVTNDAWSTIGICKSLITVTAAAPGGAPR